MIARREEEIAALRTAGRLLAEALQATAVLAHPGQSTATLDIAAETYIRGHDAEPAFLGYKPRGARLPFPAVLCVSINDEVVHGIPSEQRILQEGDILSLDLGLSYHGFFADSAITICVGEGDKEAHALIAATKEGIDAGIKTLIPGNHIGDIGAAIARVAKSRHFSVVQDLGGHGVGKVLHEEPYIANEGVEGKGEVLKEGMVLAIEPMFAEGKGSIVLAEDDWTYVMEDGSRAAHFEHTVLITKNGPEILTKQ